MLAVRRRLGATLRWREATPPALVRCDAVSLRGLISGMLMLIGLFWYMNRSLLPYNRALLTLTHTSGILMLIGLFWYMNRSLLPYNRALLPLTHTSGMLAGMLM